MKLETPSYSRFINTHWRGQDGSVWVVVEYSKERESLALLRMADDGRTRGGCVRIPAANLERDFEQVELVREWRPVSIENAVYNPFVSGWKP